MAGRAVTRVERIRLALAELVTPAITRADVLHLLAIVDAAARLVGSTINDDGQDLAATVKDLLSVDDEPKDELP